MRLAPLWILLLLPAAQAMTGHCTGIYLEQGDDWVNGTIGPGDVFEYWCELPSAVEGGDSFTVRLQYPNAELAQEFLAPRVLYGTSLVVFP